MRANSASRRDSFILIDPVIIGKRVVPVQTEEEKKSLRLQDEERKHNREAQKVMYRHAKSARSASLSSGKASKVLKKIETGISEN